MQKRLLVVLPEFVLNGGESPESSSSNSKKLLNKEFWEGNGWRIHYDELTLNDNDVLSLSSDFAQNYEAALLSRRTLESSLTLLRAVRKRSFQRLPRFGAIAINQFLFPPEFPASFSFSYLGVSVDFAGITEAVACVVGGASSHLGIGIAEIPCPYGFCAHQGRTLFRPLLIFLAPAGPTLS
ncbi:hypothetical protein K1719_028872 [Acacia pycnantha]|nr:hypothetical protein K1719_028872 [Acacia pycnantha]